MSNAKRRQRRRWRAKHHGLWWHVEVFGRICLFPPCSPGMRRKIERVVAEIRGE